MTKRAPNKFELSPRNFYPTPYKGVIPLLPWLMPEVKFVEPCAGKGDLIKHLEKHGHKSVAAYDIQPEAEGIDKADALDLTDEWLFDAEFIITNPPWSRDILHPMIDHFRKLRPTWLLLDADWAHTKQARPFLPYCELIVSVGRLKWKPDSKYSGLDNCAWYLFHKDTTEMPTMFINQEP